MGAVLHDTLILMACSATKIATDKPVALFELYDGPLWQTLRTHLPGHLTWADVFVLSGKIGFDSSWVHALPYEEKISAKKVDDLIGLGVERIKSHPTKGHAMGMTVRAKMSREGQWSRVIICGAGDYRRYFNWLVPQLQAIGRVAAAAPVLVCDGAGIGYQRQQLARYLQAPLPIAA